MDGTHRPGAAPRTPCAARRRPHPRGGGSRLDAADHAGTEFADELVTSRWSLDEVNTQPYADARSYGSIRPDHYLKWFVPFAEAIVAATAGQGAGPRTARPAMIRLDQVDENRGGSH